MNVTAKCTEPAWDSTACVYFYPGQEYEIEKDGILANLKAPTGRWVFQFDREAAAKADFGEPAGEPTPSPDKHTDPAPAVQTEPEIKVDRRGRGPFTCKVCGLKDLPHLNALMQHKKICLGKVVAPQESTQEAGATV